MKAVRTLLSSPAWAHRFSFKPLDMKQLLRSRGHDLGRRGSAVVILIAIYTIAFTLLWMLSNALGTMQLAYDSKQDLLTALQQRNALTSNAASASQDGAERRDPFFSAPTETLAAAELDDTVRRAAKETHGIVLSSHAEVSHDDQNNGNMIAIKTVVESTNDDIQTLLFRLETGYPLIFVKELSLQPKHDRGEASSDDDPTFRANLTLTAYWKDPVPKAQQP